MWIAWSVTAAATTNALQLLRLHPKVYIDYILFIEESVLIHRLQLRWG